MWGCGGVGGWGVGGMEVGGLGGERPQARHVRVGHWVATARPARGGRRAAGRSSSKVNCGSWNHQGWIALGPAAPMQPPCSVPYLLATAGVTGSSAVTRPGAASMLCSWRSAVVSNASGASVDESVCEMLAWRKPTPRASDMLAGCAGKERWRQHRCEVGSRLWHEAGRCGTGAQLSWARERY